ncbi:MAG TPA: hypothetical protein VMJ31_09000, partial [Methylocystis sp.]|nr:hypothetical protein [Methylocystis sp.]
MKASFDKQELISGLAELEKRVREHRPSGRPAAPGERLDLDLESIEAAAKSRRALSKPAAVDVTAIYPEDARERAAPPQSTTIDVAPPEKDMRVSSAGSERAPVAATLEAAALFAADPREQTAASGSVAIDLVADKEFRASASGKGSSPGAAAAKDPALRVVDPASPSPSAKIDAIPDKEFRAPALGTSAAASRPHRWIYAATAILIVIGSLVGGAGWLVGGKVLAALQTPRTLRSRIDPPLAASAAVPAPEQTADVPPAPPAAAQETVAETAPPAPEPQAATPTVEANATRGTEAPESAPVAAALPTA